MAEIIASTDLPQAVREALGDLLEVVVDGLNANAIRVAPCLASGSTGQTAEASFVLLGAAKRFSEAGSGALQSQTAGPFGQTLDTRQRTGYNLWPSEINRLQDICRTTGRKVFSVNTAPVGPGSHLPWCSVNWGGTCSCGVDIAGRPIYEQG